MSLSQRRTSAPWLRKLRSAPMVLLWCAVAACASREPAGLYRLSAPEQSTCPHPVQLFDALDQIARPYREVAELSATCPVVSPATCERTLLARACELGADAVLKKNQASIGRPGAHRPQNPEIAEEAVAIRYTAAAP